ncbi:MAG: arsenical pump-driving ATPase [Verrucomicrobia bacterium]|nr:arsenical pump-driving ATPase [Verrucomicrobiota bacterium]
MSFPAFSARRADWTRYLFFTGKGGVGKTSLSCATALRLAESGRRVLLVSTDPASNLDEVFGVALSNTPTLIPGMSGLSALNIDPEEAARAYRERVIGPMRGILPEAALRSMEEGLSGSCTVEIAAFDEFTGLIGNPEVGQSFDHIVFDTAPTGHTLRLMSLAKAWDQFLDENTSGASCLGPLAGLEKQRAVYSAAVETLADKNLTTLVLVSRPQAASLREAERTSRELRELGIGNQMLVINGVFEASGPADALAGALQRRGDSALERASGFLGSLPVSTVALRPKNILGIEGLRSIFEETTDPIGGRCAVSAHSSPQSEKWDGTAAIPPRLDFSSLDDLIAELSAPGRGVIMTMGKGGVGKTTIAAAIAVALAERGHAVHLSTTDPAAHVAEALSGEVTGLTVGRIDPVAETEAYRRHVLTTAGANMDKAGLALLEEDLRSPCTEEIAVFRAFAREVAKGKDKFVVLDTAPTGHTLLLLDATESYQRELNRQARSTQPEGVLRLLDRLRDPEFTRILLVTLPEATPVHEAAALQEDLRRARIEPFGWIINQSLFECGSNDPLLRQREMAEQRYLREVVDHLAKRVALIRWQADEPVGTPALLALVRETGPAFTSLQPTLR